MQRHRSRFPEFDAIVLASVCRSADEFHAVDAYLSSEMAEANDDRERAAIFDGILLTALKTCPDWCEGLPTVIYKGDIDALLSINRTTASWRVNKNHIGQWVKAGYLPRFYNGRWEGLSNMRDNPEWREAHFLYGIDKFNGDEPTTVQIFRGDWGNHDGRTSGRIVGTVVRGRPR